MPIIVLAHRLQKCFGKTLFKKKANINPHDKGERGDIVHKNP